jgi:hypothetical protein
MAIAFIGCMSLASMVARYGKSDTRWFPVHYCLSGLGVLAMLAGLIVALIMVGGFTIDHTHTIIGWLAIVIAFCTPFVGIAAHWMWDPDRIRTPLVPDMLHCMLFVCYIEYNRSRSNTAMSCLQCSLSLSLCVCVCVCRDSRSVVSGTCLYCHLCWNATVPFASLGVHIVLHRVRHLHGNLALLRIHGHPPQGLGWLLVSVVRVHWQFRRARWRNGLADASQAGPIAVGRSAWWHW